MSRYPYPLIGGDKIKSYYLMKHLAKSHDITLAALSFGKLPPAEDIKALEDIGVKVYPVALNPVMSGIRTGFRLWKKYPLEISFYLRDDFFRLIDKLCEENDFDLGFAFFMRTAEYLRNRKFKKVLISEDCRVLYQSRSQMNSSNILQKAVRIWEVMKLKKYEPELVNHFDSVTLVTHDDIDAMKSQNPNARYRLVTNGVDTDRFCPPYENVTRKDIIFTGKLSVWANTMMAVNIAKEIMPAVRKEVPDVKLHLVGSNPNKMIDSLRNEFVEVHGNVPDISDYYKKAKIFLHPHNAATGIQNKLLEALSSGLAAVTTKTGIQGIDGTHGEHFFLSQSNEDMIKYTIELLKNDQVYKKISRNARQLMLDTHTWDVVNNQIDAVMEEIFDE